MPSYALLTTYYGYTYYGYTYSPVLVDAERGVHARLRLLHLPKVLVEQAWRGLGLGLGWR